MVYEHTQSAFLSSGLSVLGQLERCPTTGKLHYQLAIAAPRNYRWERLRKEIGPYWYKLCQGGSFAKWMAYCTKDKTRVTDDVLNQWVHFERGTMPKATVLGRGARADVQGINSYALEVLAAEPMLSKAAVLSKVSRKFPDEFGRMSVGVERFINLHHKPYVEFLDLVPRLWQSRLLAITHTPAAVGERSIYFVRDSKGGAGKSTLVDLLFKQHGMSNVCCLMGADPKAMAYVISQMSEAPSVVICDIPRTVIKSVWVSVMFILEQLANRKVFSDKYVSQFVMLPKRPHIIVVCNDLPPELPAMLSHDRVVVWDVCAPRNVTRVINGATELVEDDPAPVVGGIEACQVEPFSAFTK
jgi:hypothetical protein